MTRRTERINHLIRQEVSELLRRQVKDPRLSRFITVTSVSTSPDLHCAKVFVSIMGSNSEKQETLQTLTSASGFFHRELKDRLEMRCVPELSFHHDDTVEQGAHVLQLIELTKNNDYDSKDQGEY